MSAQPIIQDSTGRRSFACSPAAVLAFIVNPDERVLVLAHPRRDGWEVINGALNGGETILAGVLREIREEAGEQIAVRPLGALHAYTYRYDDSVPLMISLCFVLVYEGGTVIPGDDMRGSAVQWISPDEVEEETVTILVPSRQLWLFRRAVQFYRLLKDAPPVELQPFFDETTRNKYGK